MRYFQETFSENDDSIAVGRRQAINRTYVDIFIVLYTSLSLNELTYMNV